MILNSPRLRDQVPAPAWDVVAFVYIDNSHQNFSPTSTTTAPTKIVLIPRPHIAILAMDPRDLKSASTYVNNQLAARGLLRGNPIPFHKPGEDDGTPAKIINLVHELIARRDVSFPIARHEA